MLGTHYCDLVSEHFFEVNGRYIQAASAGEKQCFERTTPGPNGALRHALVNDIPDTDDAVVAGFFVLVSDVTPLKDAEAQLKVGTAVFEYAADGFQCLTLSRRCVSSPHQRPKSAPDSTAGSPA